MNSALRAVAFCILSLVSSVLLFGQRPPTAAPVGYNPGVTVVQGDQPLSRTVELSITSPSDFVAGTPVVISPVVSVFSAPPGANRAIVLSYVALTPASLTFTAPNQTLTTTIECDFPAGIEAGEYSFKITTPGWPTGAEDPGAFLNATIYAAPEPGGPPMVSIENPVDSSSFVYQPLVGPLVIPFSFTGSAPAISPISSVDADLDGETLAFQQVNNADGSITATGNLTITAPGLYSLRARATNEEGTATDTADFTVTVSAPPPTVSIANPLPGSSFTLPASGPLSVPFSFTGLSSYGGILELTATINGSSVSFTSSGLGTLTATGSGTFNVTSGGNYELVVTASDSNGTATARSNFTVLAAVPAPTITISQPANGSTFSRVAGSAPTLIPYSYTGTASTGFTISTLTGSLNGNALTPTTTTGLNSPSATSTGTLSITAPGTYVLSATTSSSGTSASTSVTFTVTETQPPRPSCSVNWLPPISLGKPVKCGSKFAIKFELDCKTTSGCGKNYGSSHHSRDCDDDDRNEGCDRDDDRKYGRDCDDDHRKHDCDRNDDGDRDHYPGQRTKSKNQINKDVVIAVTDITNGNGATPQLFRYSNNPNVPGYTIQGNDMYHLNFPVPHAKRRYRVEIFDAPANLPARVLGTREFSTR